MRQGFGVPQWISPATPTPRRFLQQLVTGRSALITVTTASFSMSCNRARSSVSRFAFEDICECLDRAKVIRAGQDKAFRKGRISVQTKIRSWTAAEQRAVLLRAATVIGLLLFAIPPSALAQTNHTAGLTPNVEEFLDLLGKSDVQDWLRARQQASGASEAVRTCHPMVPSEKPFGTSKGDPDEPRDLYGMLLRCEKKLEAA